MHDDLKTRLVKQDETRKDKTAHREAYDLIFAAIIVMSKSLLSTFNSYDNIIWYTGRHYSFTFPFTADNSAGKSADSPSGEAAPLFIDKC